MRVRSLADGYGELLLSMEEPRDLTLKFCTVIYTANDTRSTNSLTMMVNGADAARLDEVHNWQWHDVVLPASLFRKGPNVLSFQAGWALAPSAVEPGNGDHAPKSIWLSTFDISTR